MKSGEGEDLQKAPGLEPLAQKKWALLQKYLRLTEELKACLEAGNFGPVTGLLTRRRKCAEEIERTDAVLRKAVRETWGESRNLPPAIKGLLNHHVLRITDILSRIDSLDRELHGQLGAKRDEAQSELLKLRKTHSAAGTYRGRRAEAPRFMEICE